LPPAQRQLPADASRRTGAAGEAALVALCCALSVAFFFRFQIANGFTMLFSDRTDGIIEIAILEHWYNVFRGLAAWPQADFFYPAPDALGYNDGYFLYGVVYAAVRSFGADPFLASEFVNVILRAVGFIGAVVACRRLLALDLAWSLLAAVVFTIANNSFIRAIHVQLLSVSLAPLVAVLLHATFTALRAGRRRALFGWGLASVLLFAAWLMTTYYMAWYFFYFTAVLLVLLAWLSGRDAIAAWLAAARRQMLPLVALAATGVLAILPFLSLYLPKASESGERSYSSTIGLAPSLLDAINVGNTNLLYGRLIMFLHDWLAPKEPLYSERTTGMPLIVLFLFVCAVAWLWRRREAPAPRLMIAMALAAVLTWLSIFHLGRYSLWALVYTVVPGAKAMRATARYQIFLDGPVIALAVAYLAGHARSIVRPVLVLIATLLVLEEISVARPLDLDRTAEAARLRSVPPPPAGCKVFFATAARRESLPDPVINGLYSHNVDAMMIAEYLNVPTINGYASFFPRGWALYNPGTPEYLATVARYVAAHHVSGLCGLDLATMRWDPDPPLPPVPSG
jgi:hypothetical protein